LSTIIETRQLGLFEILPPTGLEQYIFHALLIAICQVRESQNGRLIII